MIMNIGISLNNKIMKKIGLDLEDWIVSRSV